MTLKLGKLPAREDAVKLKFASFVDKKIGLPPVPETFGHYQLYPADGWGMLGNDQVGCCAWAGPAHESMIWNKASGRDVEYTTENVLSDYSACTGYNPEDPSTDRGTDMQQGAKYRQKTGIIDSKGERHKIGAYLALEAGNLTQLHQAAYMFGAVGIGIEVPDYFMAEFQSGQPWNVRRRGNIEGGHYVPIVGADQEWLYLVTWGRIQRMALNAYEKFNDETIAYLSTEQLNDSGKTPEGFDNAALSAALEEIA